VKRSLSISSRQRSIAIVLLVLLASVTGIRNGFAYDDVALIELNTSVHSLHGWWRLFAQPYWPNFGGEAYRPITSLAYALQWSVADGAPWVFHAVSIALYAAISIGVLALARLMLPEWAAWFSAALFAVHPVHVEAVANVTGQTELLVGLTVVWALVLFVRARRAGSISNHSGTATAIVVLFALGLLSKEHAIVLPALLLLAEWLLVEDPRGWKVRLVELRPVLLGMVLVVLGFFAARSRAASPYGVVGFQTYLPFLALRVTALERVLTMLGVVPEWIRLLFWPARLSSEYSPPGIPIAQQATIAHAIVLLLLAGILAIAIAIRRQSAALAFGILWVYVTHAPTSNFFIPASFLLTERTLFLPSAGAMLALGAILVVVRERFPSRRFAVAGATAIAVVLALGVLRSATRSPVWRSNETLFPRAVIDAPLSYRAHYVLGMLRFGQGRLPEGEREYRRALALFPYDPYVALGLAGEYQTVGLCQAALPLYGLAYRVNPSLPAGHGDYARCLLRLGRRDDAKRQILIGIRNGDNLGSLIGLLHENAARR
jgi:tetratricopeptide (TPR) repeat protein